MKAYAPPELSQLLEELGYTQHKLASQQFREALLSEHPGYMQATPLSDEDRQELHRLSSNNECTVGCGNLLERLSLGIGYKSESIHLSASGYDSVNNPRESD